MKTKFHTSILIIGLIILVAIIIWAAFQVVEKEREGVIKEEGMMEEVVEEEEEVIKIGAIIFLTGDQSMLGEEVNNALLLANESDDFKSDREMVLIVEDSQDDPSKAIGAYNKMREDGIAVIISTGDQVSYALSPLAERDQVILLMTVAASQDISGDYTFRGFITAQQQARIMAEYSIKDMDIKNTGIIYINNIYGNSYKNVFIDTVESNGGRVLSQETYGIADKDINTQILKVLGSEPEAVVVAGFGPAYPLVFKQLRENGWQGIILTDNTLSIPYFFDSIEEENLESTYFTSTNFNAFKPANQQMYSFVKRYKDRFGIEPSFVGAFAFDLYNMLLSVIEECGYEVLNIRGCLLNIRDKQGILGPIDFSSQEMRIPLYIKKVDKGIILNEKVIE